MAILLHEFGEASTMRSQLMLNLSLFKFSTIRSSCSSITSNVVLDGLFVCEIGPLGDAILQLKRVRELMSWQNRGVSDILFL